MISSHFLYLSLFYMEKFQLFAEIQGKANKIDFLVWYFPLGLSCLKALLELKLGVSLPQCQLIYPAQSAMTKLYLLSEAGPES